MKPRWRDSGDGTWDVLTHDRYAPLIPVSGFARPFLPGRLARLPSHEERKILIGCQRSLSAVGPDLSRYSQNLARGFGHGSLSPNDQHAGVLSHEGTLSRLYSHGREK
jgi:hypothetical protein